MSNDPARTSLDEARRLLDAAEEVAPEAENPFGPRVTSAGDITPREVNWLWPQHIPLGKLVMIAGDPGLGKSFLSVDLAARASAGRQWPDGSPGDDPAGVLLVSAEDDAADTTVPRLVAAGADRDRVAILEGIRDMDGQGRMVTRPPSLESDVPHLEAAIKRVPNCRLVVLDPVSAYMGGTDSHNNTEVRGLLAPLADMAQRQEVAMVAITHLNKGQGKAIYRAMGSLAFVAAARTVWAVSADEEDPERRLFVPVKNNIGQDREGLAYRIEASPKIEDSGRVDYHGQPALRWEEEPLRMSADEALAPAEERTEKDEAGDWIREQLAHGPRPVQELKQEAQEAGLGWATVQKARAKVGAKSLKRGFSGGWAWALPHHLPEDGQPSQKDPGPSQGPPSGDDISSPGNRDLQGAESAHQPQGGRAEGVSQLGEPDEPPEEGYEVDL